MASFYDHLSFFDYVALSLAKELKVKTSCERSFDKTRAREAAETYPFFFPVTGPSGSELSIGKRSKNPQDKWRIATFKTSPAALDSLAL